jgi:phosphoserine phosphatase
VPGSLLVTVTGTDGPGIAAGLFDAIGGTGLGVLDVEQIRVHGRLLLCLRLAGSDPVAVDQVHKASRTALERLGSGDLQVSVTELPLSPPGRRAPRHLVTVLAPELPADVLGGVFSSIAACGGNVERILRLSAYPVMSYELTVACEDPGLLRRRLVAAAAALGVDVAVQRAGLHRRAKHLIVIDADSTLLQGEVIDILAARAGCADAVSTLTQAAMAGAIDFGEALRRRVELLVGTPTEVLEAVTDEVLLTPGARTLVRTLQRLGYVIAVVSGGFVQVVEPLARRLGIAHVAANTLEIRDGRLTGRILGPVLDRAGKAAALATFAELAGVPLARTVAVGDGANDIDMLSVAGLGIAFNAKPAVRQVADTSISVPYLDAILFLLGIPREEIEADEEAP